MPIVEGIIGQNGSFAGQRPQGRALNGLGYPVILARETPLPAMWPAFVFDALRKSTQEQCVRPQPIVTKLGQRATVPDAEGLFNPNANGAPHREHGQRTPTQRSAAAANAMTQSFGEMGARRVTVGLRMRCWKNNRATDPDAFSAYQRVVG
jgi:hypothetical protein